MANSTSQGNVSSINASIRRIGEDPLLRPFLSSLFDPQNYTKNIIRDGKSEECFTAINDSVEQINEEIHKYISQNKDVLMAGMQDVASLAKRYGSLSEQAKMLNTTVVRLKKEVSTRQCIMSATR